MRMHHRSLTLPSSKSKECPPWRSGALQVWQRKHSLWKWNPSALSLSTTNTRFLHAWHTSPRLRANSFFKEGWGQKKKKNNWSRLCWLSMLKPTVIHVWPTAIAKIAVHIQTVVGTVFHNAVCLIRFFNVINEPEVISELIKHAKCRSFEIASHFL